jgi:sugar lactone lactonase YvrE
MSRGEPRVPGRGDRQDRRSTARTLACFTAFLLLLCAGVASATSEVITYFGTESGTGALGGQFNNPRDIAVNASGAGSADPGDIYVVDDTNHRLQRFDKDGDFISAQGADVSLPDGGTNYEICTVSAECQAAAASGGNGTAAGNGTFNSPQSAAVDNDTGLVYVSDRINRRISFYDGAGAFQRSFGFDVEEGGVTTYEICGDVAGDICKAGAAGAGVGQIGNSANAGTMGIAASPADGNSATGEVFLADTANKRVNTYNLDGSPPPASFGSEANFGNNQPRKVAVDSRGIVYASDNNNNGEIDRYDSENANGGGIGFLSSIPVPPLLAGAAATATAGLAVDPDTDGIGLDEDALYVLRDPTEGPTVVLQFGPSNDPGLAAAPTAVDDVHGKGANFAATNGLGLNHETGQIYVSANFGGGHRVYILDFPLQPPLVSIDPVTTFTGTTATFTGNVKPDKIAAGYHFEYSADGVSWTKVPTTDVPLPGDSTNHPVSEEVEDLVAQTKYQVRLVATKALGGGTATAETNFKTLKAPPKVSGLSHSDIRDVGVTFEGTIHPQNEATNYRFEYVEKEAFEFEGFSNPLTTPVPAGSIPPGGSEVAVKAQVDTLTPSTTYFYRLTAVNATGTAHSEAGTFTTYFDAFDGLPDGRAYEQASPVAKNGLDVSGTPDTVKASIGGGCVTFGADGGIPGGVGSQRLPTYLACRGSGDWSAKGILPPVSEGERGQVLGWTRDFAHVFSEARRIADPVEMTFLSRASDGGSIATIVPHQALGAGFAFAGASSDDSKVFFEIAGPGLADEAVPGRGNLYVWDRESEELSLVGLLPDPECSPAPCAPSGGSLSGPFDWANANTDRGGATTGYYVQDQHAISSDGERAYFTAAVTGQLYLRNDPAGPGASTVRVSASKRTNGKAPDGTDAAGPHPAAFMAATPDGSSAFFTSPEKLTNDATTGPEPEDPAAIARAPKDDGDPVDIDFLPASASDVAVDGGHVYWIDPKTETIGHAELDGDPVEPALIALPEIEVGPGAFSPANPRGIAVDSEHVYWTNAADGGTGKGTIGRADRDGADIRPKFIEEATKPEGIDVNATHIFWGNFGLNTSGNGAVGRANLDGTGTPEQKFVPSRGGGDVAVDDTHIYHSRIELGGGHLRRIDIDDGIGSPESCSPALSGAAEVPDIALDSSFVYLTHPAGDRIARNDLTCGGPSFDPEFVASAGNPVGLAVDAEHLYWAANQDVPANPGNDLYRYDADTGDLTDLTVDDTSPNGAEVRGVLGVSDDGSDVYLVANGVLTSDPNAQGETATSGNCPVKIAIASGECNLYHLHDGNFDFIARLAHHGDQFVTDAANWTGTPKAGFIGVKTFEKSARVTPDGETLLFGSHRELTDYDNEGQPMLYRYQASDQSLACISCNPSGEPPVGVLTKDVFTSILPSSEPAATLRRTLSEDGRRVFFQSTDPLVVTDTNGEAGCPVQDSSTRQAYPSCQDVYMWEAAGTGSCESEAQNGGCIYLISAGQNPAASLLADASASGDDVFFVTRDRLVGQDGDQLYDTYDARVGGGLASQNESPEPICVTVDGCRGGPTSPPTFDPPLTPGFAGPGDPPPVRKAGCRKGKRKARVKGRARCVRKRSRRLQRQRHHRNANATRRASR